MARWLVLALVFAGCREDPAAIPDAASDGVSSTCTGACQETVLTAMFASTRVLDHAVYGNNASSATLHVEAYLGGETGCPSQSSPTPDYTLVLGKVASPTGTAPTTSPGNVLDFVGDLLGGELGAQATLVIVRAVAASPDDFVALDVDLEFPTGPLTGHLYATHCTSLDSL